MPEAAGSPRGARIRRYRLVGALVTILVLGGGGAAAWAASGPSAPPYRTAVARLGDVSQAVESTGTIVPVAMADLGFAEAGRVTKILVAQGQQVAAGQEVAGLDLTPFSAQVASALSTLAADQAKLATDQASQTSAGSTSSSASSTAGPGAAATGASGPARSSGGTGTGTGTTLAATPASSPATAGVTRAQGALVADQRRADLDQSRAGAALSRAAACVASVAGAPATTSTTAPASASTTAPATTTTGAPATTSTTAPATTTTGAPATTSTGANPARASNPGTGAPRPTRRNAGGGPSGGPATGAAGSPSLSSCLSQLQIVAADQTSVSGDQRVVTADQAALTAAIRKLQAATTTSRPAGPPAAATTAASGSSAGAASAPSSGGVAGTRSTSSVARTPAAPASAAQISADQAAIDAAQAQLTNSRQALGDAQLVSPVSGTVASVNLTVGQQVTTGKVVVVVVAPGSFEVQTTTTDATVSEIRPGEQVSVLPDGTTSPIPGRVSAVGLVGSQSSQGTVTYPVTVALGRSHGLFAGSSAQVSIVVNRVTRALTVPTSAVRTIGSLETVQVLGASKPTTVRVTVGAVGATLTQVLSGLTPGDRVVLAALDAALPTAGATPFRALRGAALIGRGPAGGAIRRVGAGGPAG